MADNDWKENERPSSLPVPPTTRKVAVEMNLSESCFLELKPDSLGKGETLVCSWLAVGGQHCGGQSSLKEARRDCSGKGMRSKGGQLASCTTACCGSAQTLLG